MAQIVSKLNLNKTPSIVENNSLIFAKNIRVEVDGTIHRDYGISSIVEEDYVYEKIWKDCNISFDEYQFINIVGVINDSRAFYLFIIANDIKQDSPTNGEHISFIIKYDEDTKSFTKCHTGWKHCGGTITGSVIHNLVGDTILIVAEYDALIDAPIKFINLNTSTDTTDESLYTQSPKIPITNIEYLNTFDYNIPCGVYQFFIRYRVSENFYTDWFPASKELFAGNSNTTVTNFGTLTYSNPKLDSNSSFKLGIKHLIEDNKKLYKDFQIGFILSHDDTILARAWKHYSLDTETIYFDYDAKDAEEIEVIDVLKSTYQLYNVGNVISFKNKVYISNYKETEFDSQLVKGTDFNIDVELKEVDTEVTDASDNDMIITTINTSERVSSGVKIENQGTTTNLLFGGQNGVIDKLLSTKNENDATDTSIAERITSTLNSAAMEGKTFKSVTANYTTLRFYTETLQSIKTATEKRIRDNYLLDKHLNPDDGYYINDIRFTNTITDSSLDYAGKIHSLAGTTGDTLYNSFKELFLANGVYLKTNGDFVNIIGTPVTRTRIIINRSATIEIWKKITDEDNATTSDEKYAEDETTYQQIIELTLVGDKWKNIVDTSLYYKNISTLIPFQSYKFYVHFVKDNGEITNGYFIDELKVQYQPGAKKIIYPKFTITKYPNNYKACFFSILHTKTIASTIFDISKDTASTYGLCLDMSMMLTKSFGDITVKQGPDIEWDPGSDDEIQYLTNKARFYHSSDANHIPTFGGPGILDFKDNSFLTTKYAYALAEYHVSDSVQDANLVKCTPYILLEGSSISYDEHKDSNLLGYICKVTTLNKDRCLKYFSDGSTILKRESTGNYTEVDTDNGLHDTITNLAPTNEKIIYSNFNLNYVNSTIDNLDINFKTYYSGTDTNKTSIVKISRLIRSVIADEVYELPSMYRSYTRKTFIPYNAVSNTRTRFDNTIRSSLLIGDEERANICKFDANDYYNVPTNKGIIVNLISVGDAILVHTRHSIFKFSGSNNLASMDGEILVNESQPFDTGIVELFGNDFGYAGLYDKEDAIICESGYIFFDRDCRTIYQYQGSGRITKLSDDISKLFKHREIRSIKFANDYYNDRMFICIKFCDDLNVFDHDYPVTLSYNISEKVKSFVSLHDFSFDKAFNTKANCYFLAQDYNYPEDSEGFNNICFVDRANPGVYNFLELDEDKIYPYIYKEKTLDKLVTTSIVDVIVNADFEYIKTLNNISWSSYKLESEFKNIDSANPRSLCVADDFEYTQPCDKLRIYTDTCMTELLDFSKVSNDYSISDVNSYKYPRFNQGIWSFNYFRNILNVNNNKMNPLRQYTSDENSLIKGKYFVVRFLFNDNFKLDTLQLTYN